MMDIEHVDGVYRLVGGNGFVAFEATSPEQIREWLLERKRLSESRIKLLQNKVIVSKSVIKILDDALERNEDWFSGTTADSVDGTPE